MNRLSILSSLLGVSLEDFILAINKVFGSDVDEVLQAFESLEESKKDLITYDTSFSFIAVPSLEKVLLVRISDIIYLQSDGRYTSILLAEGKKIIASKNLGEFEKKLDKRFFRIHKLYIVNLNQALNFNKTSGNYCEMMNGKRLPVAKRRQTQLLLHLGLRK